MTIASCPAEGYSDGAPLPVVPFFSKSSRRGHLRLPPVFALNQEWRWIRGFEAVLAEGGTALPTLN